MKFSGHRAAIKDRSDLMNYLYWTIGTLTMEEIAEMLNVINQYLPISGGIK